MNMNECNHPCEVCVLCAFKLKVAKSFHARYCFSGDGSNEKLGCICDAQDIFRI